MAYPHASSRKPVPPISSANESSGEPNGEPTEIDTWRRWATSGDGSVASDKQGVTSSNPVAPTRSEGVWGFRSGWRGAKRRKKGQAGSHVADASVRRRGHGGDAICFAADKNRYIGAVSVGFSSDGKRLRRKSPVRPSRRSRTSSECCKGAQRRAPVFGGIHGPSGGGGLARAWVVGPVGADDPVVPGRRRLCRPSRPRS